MADSDTIKMDQQENSNGTELSAMQAKQTELQFTRSDDDLVCENCHNIFNFIEPFVAHKHSGGSCQTMSWMYDGVSINSV